MVTPANRKSDRPQAPMSTLRTYKRLRARKPLNRVSPKKFQPKGDWHHQVIRLDGTGMHELRNKVFNRSAGFCENCHARITWHGFELAHVIARGKGGSDTEENCRALCQKCH